VLRLVVRRSGHRVKFGVNGLEASGYGGEVRVKAEALNESAVISVQTVARNFRRAARESDANRFSLRRRREQDWDWQS